MDKPIITLEEVEEAKELRKYVKDLDSANKFIDHLFKILDTFVLIALEEDHKKEKEKEFLE